MSHRDDLFVMFNGTALRMTRSGLEMGGKEYRWQAAGSSKV